MSDASGAVVHVIDDDNDIRLSLDSLLRSVGLDTELHPTPPSLQAFNLGRPQCALVDVRLRGSSGLDFQDQLVRSNVGVPVIMMTGFGDIPMSVRAMKAGAVDFLPKPFRDQDLLDAVTRAIDIDRCRRVREAETSTVLARYSDLSEREKEVMALVVTGKMNKQVAASLALSEVTVKVHRGAAMRKMQARSLADLIKMNDAVVASAG